MKGRNIMRSKNSKILQSVFGRAAAVIMAAASAISMVPVSAATTADQTLSINYHCSGKQIDGAEFTIVKVADLGEGTYTMVDPFDDSEIDPNEITESNVKDSAKTLQKLYKEGGVGVTTDDDGEASVSIDEYGMYIVMQTGKKNGAEKYHSSNPMLVKMEGSDVTIEPKTSKKSDSTSDDDDDDDTDTKASIGAVSVYKVDADNNNIYLEGAVFGLYKADGTKVGTYTTDKNGCFTVSYLTYGNYYLIEEKAPEGYVGGKDKITFTLNSTTSFSNAYPWNIKVTNVKQDNEAADTGSTSKTVKNKGTGDASNIPLMIAGIGAAACVIGVVVYKNRKEKKHGD